MKTIRYIVLIAAVLGQTAIMHAEFRAGISVQIVTPNPLLPVSGGVGPSNPASEEACPSSPDGPVTHRQWLAAGFRVRRATDNRVTSGVDQRGSATM